jgi:hypothetical protein
MDTEINDYDYKILEFLVKFKYLDMLQYVYQSCEVRHHKSNFDAIFYL